MRPNLTPAETRHLRRLLGWPTERRHRLTGRVQHIRYNESGKWTDGPLPKEGLHGRR